ncbi:phage portal protein [Bombilactobacillus folatiphilus]|uniref:Phage portal protein n=1 Tax=Bombilactobacillus folatiphilus TaxID=2923362 RepID=A0ABY4P7R6_9LACO|nr:phage portal protein [Bombilactobacillus folatiphilus]UQS81564.1 phage portal protein [Bombilactobacillus folatiphilus]
MLTKGSIDYNGNYLFPKGQDLTQDDIKEFIEYHRANDVPVFKEKLDYYLAHPKNSNRIDDYHNHLVVNMSKYLVDTLNGFFVGIPPTIKIDGDSINQALQDWLNESDFTDELSEVSKQSSLYGKTYLLIYTNENSETKVTVVPPYSGFIIYDDSVAHEPLAFVQYTVGTDLSISGTVYLADRLIQFNNATVINEQSLLFQGVPAIEFYDNEERTGITDDVKTLIDSLNKTLSNKADDVDYFADAYLFLKGFQLDDGDQLAIKDSRLIQAIAQDSSADIDAKFLEKPNADTTQEHLIDRITNLIFQISMVANINDEVFGNATSGRSLEYKLLSMRNLTSNKERKFTKQLRKVFNLVTKTVSFGLNVENLGNKLEFHFVRNLPNNNSEEADTANKLNGIVSQETLLSTLSFVSDPKAELKKIADEQDEKVKRVVVNQQQFAGSDSEKSDNSDEDDEQ